MKRAKVILTSLVVLAVVGGALAFKANKAPVYCVYTLDGATCPLDVTILNTKAGSDFINATTRPYAGCPATVPTADCKFTFSTTSDIQ